MADKRKITIEIDNLTDSQVIAIKDFLAVWQFLGNIGSSRWTAFYADGDGNFRPKILVDGAKPEQTELGIPPKQRWGFIDSGDVYKLDFDAIAWALRAQQESGPKLVTEPGAAPPESS